MSRIKQLSKDSIIYGLGGSLVKGISFFLLPVYTRIFTPSDYGKIEMLTVITSFLCAILIVGMDSAQSFFFFKEKTKKRQSILITSILQWRISWGIIIVLLATLLSPILNNIFFDGSLNWTYFGIAFSGALFYQILNQSLEVLRLLYKAWSFVLLSFFHSILSASIILILILIFDQGILGYFLGILCSSLLNCFLGWFLIKDYINFDKLNFKWWPKLIRFGAPLLFADIAFYFMSSADRWFIKFYNGDESLGIFSIGAKFSMLVVLVFETFRKAWWPIAMDAMHSDDGPETFRVISRIYVSIALSAVIILTYVSPSLVKLLTSSEYHSAWPIVGILSLQAFFYAFFLIACAGIWKTEKTHLNFYLMAGAALLGILLNWIFVPIYGPIGAASASALTYFVWIVATIIISEKLWYVKFPVQKLFCQVMIGVLFLTYFNQIGYFQPLFLSFGVLIISIFLIFYISFTKEEIQFIKSKLK